MISPIFFNSAAVRARPSLVLRGGARAAVDYAVRWALLPETPTGACLIDTGYTHALTRGKRSWGLRLYNYLLRPKLLAAGQIGAALRSSGLTEADISAVIITHFHVDHICGLRAFKNARIFVSQSAFEQVSRVSAAGLWLKGIFPELLPANLAERATFIEKCGISEICGFTAYDIFGNGQCLALPLPGHARGHFGLLFPDEKFLYAADCAWSLNALEPGREPAWLANRIIDNSSQSCDSMNIVRSFMAYGYKIMLCHEPGKSPYDA